MALANNIIGMISGIALIVGYLYNCFCEQHKNPVSFSLSTHKERARGIIFRKFCILLFLILFLWICYFLLFCLDKNIYVNIWGDQSYVIVNGLEGYTPTSQQNKVRNITINVCTILAAVVSLGVYIICKKVRECNPTYAPLSKLGKASVCVITVPIVYYGRMIAFGAMYNLDFKEYLLVDLIASIFIGVMIYAEINIILYKKLNNTVASIMTIYNDVPIYIFETKENCAVVGDNYFLEESSDVRIIPLEKIENSLYTPLVELDSVLLKKNVVFDRSVPDKHNFVLRTIAADYFNRCHKVLPRDGEITIEYKFSDFIYTINSGDSVKTYSVYRNYLRDNEWKGNVLFMDSLMNNFLF